MVCCFDFVTNSLLKINMRKHWSTTIGHGKATVKIVVRLINENEKTKTNLTKIQNMMQNDNNYYYKIEQNTVPSAATILTTTVNSHKSIFKSSTTPQ